MRSGKLDSLQKNLEENGCIVLRNESSVLIKDGEEVTIVGVDDPQSSQVYINEKGTLKNEEISEDEEILKDEIDKATKGIAKAKYKILLSHRPEKFPLYVKNNMDITFSGHAHGGQVRVPFIGAIIAPHQGFFPKYSSGMYREGESTMIVSRGLGNSLVPVRILNRPEIVITTLLRE
jgi:predicted MPP superfamily phosphohydrolase